jgi:hypothetical protein
MYTRFCIDDWLIAFTALHCFTSYNCMSVLLLCSTSYYRHHAPAYTCILLILPLGPLWFFVLFAVLFFLFLIYAVLYSWNFIFRCKGRCLEKHTAVYHIFVPETVAVHYVRAHICFLTFISILAM